MSASVINGQSEPTPKEGEEMRNHYLMNGGSGDDDDEEDLQPELHVEFTDDVHKANMLASLNMMRKNRHFCDVILHVGSVEVHAHKAVLASASPYLFELFTTDHDQKRTENVVSYKLNGGFDKHALQVLVDYAYTGKLDVRYDQTHLQVKAVFLAANHLKMDRVMKICAQHLMKHLSVENCIEVRSLPGIARNKEFIQQVDAFIAGEFAKVCKNNSVLNLICAKIEVLNQSREEMSWVNQASLCRLVLEWIKRQMNESSIAIDHLADKTFMLYLAIDNSLQDCSSLPTGDVSDTDIVQDYKKMSLKNNNSASKSKRKFLSQPSKPRVLIYNREIGEELEFEIEPDWHVIASEKVGEHSFLALVTLGGKLCTLSIQLRLNTPSTPSPVQTPTPSSRPATTFASAASAASASSGEDDKPDLYCALANMSCPRCAVGCDNYNETLLVCGGYDRTECLRSAEQYVPEANVWRPMPQMRESRGRFKIVVSDDKVYAIGGSNGTTELNSVEMLDMSAGKWVKMPPLPLARSNIGVCHLDGLIYCIGGWNGQVGIKQCDVFDPNTSKWTSIAPLHTGRYQAGVTAFNDLVYAIGGCDAWNCLSTVETYNPCDNRWRFAEPITTARRGCGVAVFHGKLYAVGGSDGTHSLSSTEVYDEVERKWVGGPSMTTPRANVEVAVVGDRLYAVGGFSGKTFLNTIEYLDAKSNEWTTFIPKGTCDILLKKKPRSRRNSRRSISEEQKSPPKMNGAAATTTTTTTTTERPSMEEENITSN